MAKEIEFSRIDPEAAEKKSLGEGDDDEAKVKDISSTFAELFMYAEAWDVFLMVVGTIGGT